MLCKLKNNFKYIILIFLVTFIVFSVTINGKVSFGHDYDFHLTNIRMANDILVNKKFIFPITGIFGLDIANGFGYGTGIFYGPLSYTFTTILAIFTKKVGFGYDYAFTLYSFIINFLSGIFMFILLNKITKNKNSSIIGAVTYITNAYFLCDIFTRCALGELLVFLFIPIVLIGIYELIYGKKEKFYTYFIIGFVGMFLSHLVLSIFLIVFISILLLFDLKDIIKEKKYISLIIATFIIILLCSPFFIGILEHKINGNYVVFQTNSMYSDLSILENSLNFSDFFISHNSKYNNINTYINIITLFLSFTTILNLGKIKDRNIKKISIKFIVLLCIFTILCSKYFLWEYAPNFIKMIQFPWRMLIFINICLSVLTGVAINIFMKENNNLMLIILICLIVYIGINERNDKWIGYANNDYANNLGVQNEYLPVNTLNNIDYYNDRNKDILVIDGNASINIIDNNTPYLKASISTMGGRVELPRLYYLGYKITLKTENGIVKKIPYYENSNGFIEIYVGKSGILEVNYCGTLSMNIAKIISNVVLLLLILFKLLKFKLNKK